MSGDTGLSTAIGASLGRTVAELALAPEHGFDPLVEAKLAQVVQRLRAAWLAGPALLWDDIHPIHKVARSELEKRIAGTLAGGFAQFSQLLCGFEVLLLQLQQLRVVREQTLLGIEQLGVQLGDGVGHQVEIAHAQRRLAQALCGCQCADGGRNQSIVHRGSHES